jgi:quercetin dioxygenase-like cupin family protein
MSPAAGCNAVSWEGIRIVEDVLDGEKCPGVETLEGRIGPLLKGEGLRAHYIEMQGGLYCEEHPHPTESLIFTVRGRWVLCSGKRRHLMNPGTLFWFGPNTPTGYEVPFDEPAFILIFKGGEDGMDDESFIEYLQGLKDRLEMQHGRGIPFRMEELPDDHPARLSAQGLKAR